MKIVEEARNLLEKYHYMASPLGEDMLQFEDETLLGFICELPLMTILESWTSRQDEFLRKNAVVLRHSALKAWNLYSVFLSSEIPNENDRRALVTIEEDFRASRKVVHTAMQTVGDVTRALYPFIPIQNIASLEESDSLRKLQGRLSELPSAAVDALLNERVSDERSILKRFQEAHEIKAN
jgi:hypothetical protein